MKRPLLFFGLLLASLLALFWIFREGPRFVDEWGHGEQILRLAHGDFTRVSYLTTFPGYHALMAVPVTLTGAESLVALRFFSFLGGAAALSFFFQIMTMLCARERYWRTVQLAWFPLLFPYWFLVYTDLWGLAAVLLAVWLALRKKTGTCALAAALAVLIRQPNIFWAGLLWLALMKPYCDFAAKDRGRRFCQGLGRTWPFLMLFAAFLIFMGWNGGVALGDRSVQQVTLNLTNVWFFLFTVCLLFLPDCVRGLRLAGQRWRSERGFRLWTVGILGVSWGLFGLTYELSSLYNKINLDYVLHNSVLYAVATQPWARVMALGVIPLGLAGWFLTPFLQERWRWLLPLGLLSVAVLPYVEPRYYIVPFALFLAFRQPLPRRVEIGLTLFYGALSLWIDIAAFRMWFFP